MNLAPRPKAILIMIAGIAFVILGIYQAVVPDAWGGGGQWVTYEDGSSEFIIYGEATPEQEIKMLKAENEKLKNLIDGLIDVIMEQLKVIQQLAAQ